MRYIFMPIVKFFWNFIAIPIFLLSAFIVTEIIMIIAGMLRFIWNLENPFETMEFAKYRSWSIQMLCPFKLTKREMAELQAEVDSQFISIDDLFNDQIHN